MRSFTASAFALALALAACTEAPPFDPSLETSVVANGGMSGSAMLTGDQEVPPRETSAHGQATFRLTDGGAALTFRLMVANIENVIAAHIHLAPAGLNGPVVVFLFGPAAPGGGPSNGLIAEGSITADDLVGPLAGLTLSDLVGEIIAGRAYVNVHTNDGVGAANTGPGDFASGEIRGQIR